MVATQQKQVLGDVWEQSLVRPQPRCTQCEAPFGEGAQYVSLLEIGDDGLRRRDVCPSCHEKSGGEGFAFWRGQIARHDGRRRRQLDVNFLVDFFKRLREPEAAPQHEGIAYIVALILVRKKILTLSRADRDPSALVVRFANEPDSPWQRLPVPEIDAERMAAIKDDLTRIFNLEEGGAPGGGETKSATV
jgi:hypothetical protein